MYSVKPFAALRERLGRIFARFHFQFEANLIAFLEGDIEVAGVKDLSQFLLHRAQNLVLIQPGTDRLANLSEEFDTPWYGAGRRA